MPACRTTAANDLSRAQGLHKVGQRVEAKQRRSVFPADLGRKYENGLVPARSGAQSNNVTVV